MLICIAKLCVLALVMVAVVCGQTQHAKVTLRGDGAQLVWIDDSGNYVTALKQQGSGIVLDAPLSAEGLHVAQNKSLAGVYALISNLTEQLTALRPSVLNYEASSASTEWAKNDYWFDLKTTVSGDLVGYAGGFAYDNFAYYVPYETVAAEHGHALRISTENFSPSGVESFNLATEVDSGLVGYWGGFAHDGFVYYTPFRKVGSAHGRALRINTSDFQSTGVEWFDLGDVDSALKGFGGAFTDGEYAYYVPFLQGVTYHGNVARVNMSNFTIGGVEWFDLASVDSRLKGFRGGFAAGGYGYYVPNNDNVGVHGNVVRVNLSNFSSSGVEWFDVVDTVDSGLRGFVGGFAAGDYAYYVPYQDVGGDRHGRVMRINMSNFNSSGTEWFDMAETVNDGLLGFLQGFTVGGYAYYVPYRSPAYHGRIVRIDMSNFSPSGVEWFDLATIDEDLKGFNGGFSDGDYAYYVPTYDGAAAHGRVVRIPV